jgi:subtilisin family serine protease
VTAGGKTGLASYANRGDFVDVIAPGSSIIQFGGRTYYVSGTSASTAYISGLAAGMAASTGASAAALRSKLVEVFGVKK